MVYVVYVHGLIIMHLLLMIFHYVVFGCVEADLMLH